MNSFNFTLSGKHFICNLEQEEEINIQQEQNEETRIQKIEERLKNLWTTSNAPTSKS